MVDDGNLDPRNRAGGVVVVSFNYREGIEGYARIVGGPPTVWRVSENTVARSMARQDLAARAKKRRKGLTRPDKASPLQPEVKPACNIPTRSAHQRESTPTGYRP